MTRSAKTLCCFQDDGITVEVRQRQTQRSLYINGIEQSRIDTQDPARLVLPVHRALLAAMLFMDAPRKLLLAGTGGGALARHIHAVLPACRGDAVEISEQIVTLCRQYFCFPEHNWQLWRQDIRQWQGNDYDLIIADIAQGNATPAWLTAVSQLQQFYAQLNDRGVLVMDLLPDDAPALVAMLQNIRQVFERRTLCLSVPGYKNIVVIAFRAEPVYGKQTELQTRVASLSAQWRIDYDALLQQIRQDNPADNGVFTQDVLV